MENDPCAQCRSKPSVFICFCEQKGICQDCLSSHLIQNQGIAHQPVPLAAKHLVEEIRSEVAEDFVAAELTPVKALIEAELTKLAEFQATALEELTGIRKKWVEEIDRAVAEIGNIVRDKCGKAETQLKMQLEKLQAGEKVKRKGGDFQIAFLKLDLQDLLREMMPMGLQQGAQIPLYKFSGGQRYVTVFDPSSERLTSTLQVPTRFLHSCCWTLSSDNLVYLTGGSLDGHSRPSVFTYFPQENQVSALPDMLAARRSHTSVVLDTSLYVFGGIDKEQKLDSSEAFSLSASEWQPLPNLTHPRAYLGCTAYHGAVFITGGARDSVLEVYHPNSNSFLCFSLPKVDLTEACSLLALENSILIFHGNYRGQVLEYKPETGTVDKLADMCHGNSWSACQPILYSGKVYSVRLDAVISFEMETRKSTYCSRINRVVREKGRVTQE